MPGRIDTASATRPGASTSGAGILSPLSAFPMTSPTSASGGLIPPRKIDDLLSQLEEFEMQLEIDNDKASAHDSTRTNRASSSTSASPTTTSLDAALMSPLLSPMSPVSGGGQSGGFNALGSGVQVPSATTSGGPSGTAATALTANSSPATPAANIDLTKYMPMAKSSSFGHNNNKNSQSPLTARKPSVVGNQTMPSSALSQPPQSTYANESDTDHEHDDGIPPPPLLPTSTATPPRRASASATISPGGTRRPSQQQPHTPIPSTIPTPTGTAAAAAGRRASSPHTASAAPPLAISTNPNIQRVAGQSDEAVPSPTIIMDPIAKVSNLRSKFDQPMGTTKLPGPAYHHAPTQQPRPYQKRQQQQQQQQQQEIMASHITTTNVGAPVAHRVPLETHAVDSDDEDEDAGHEHDHGGGDAGDDEDDPTFGGLGSGKVRSLKSLFEAGGAATSLSNLHVTSPQHEAVSLKYFTPDVHHVDTEVDTEVEDDDDIPPPPPPPRAVPAPQQPAVVDANKRVSFSATNSVQQVSSVSLMSEAEPPSPRPVTITSDAPRHSSAASAAAAPPSPTVRMPQTNTSSGTQPPTSPTAAGAPGLAQVYETIVQEANVVLSRKSSRVDAHQLAQATAAVPQQLPQPQQSSRNAAATLAPLQVSTATAESMLMSRQQSLTELFRLLDLPLDSTTPGGPLADSSALSSPHKTSSRNTSKTGTLTRQLELAKATPAGQWTPSSGEGVSPGHQGASPSQVISEAYQWLNSQRGSAGQEEQQLGPPPQLPHPSLVSPIVPPPPPGRAAAAAPGQRPLSTTSSMFAQRATQVLDMEWGDEVSMLADLLYGAGNDAGAASGVKLPEVDLKTQQQLQHQPTTRIAIDTAAPRQQLQQDAPTPPRSPLNATATSSSSTVNRDRALTDAPPPVPASLSAGLPNSQSVPNALAARGSTGANGQHAQPPGGSTRLTASEMAERLRQAEERRAAQRAAAAVSLSNSHPTHAPAPHRAHAHGLDAADPRVAEALAKLAAAQVQKMPIRVYINDMAVFKTVEITSVMAAGVVAEAVAERAVLAGMVPNSPSAGGGGNAGAAGAGGASTGGGGWTLFEVFADVGIERPLRDWERVTDVMRSWERDTKNAFLLRRYGYKSSLTVDALKMFYPGVRDYLHIETKPGTFKRKYFELRLGIEQNYTGSTGPGGAIALNPKSALVEREVAGLYMSNAEDKQAVLLCSLAHYDVYTPINGPRKRAPTKYGFALKSQQRMSLFEDPNDGFVFYLYTYSMEKMKEWVLALRNAKAHVDRVLRPEWLAPFEELQQQQQQQAWSSASRPMAPATSQAATSVASNEAAMVVEPMPQQQQKAPQPQQSIYQAANSNIAIAAQQAQSQPNSPPRQQHQQQPPLPRGVVASNSVEYRPLQPAAASSDYPPPPGGTSRPPPAPAMGTSAAASYPTPSASYNISSTATAQRPLPNPPVAVTASVPVVAPGSSNSMPRSTSSSLRDPPFPTSASNKSNSLTRPVAPGETYMDRIETQRVQLATAVAQAKKAPGSNGPLVDIIPEGHGRR